jgi:hypothetical protein
MPNTKDDPKPSDDPSAGVGADGTPADKELARELENEGRAGKGINQAGFVKDQDAPDAGKQQP